ncbi:hypothetical protein [Neolewinella persica]|uniref:hypothetical protein n=1 Tax=Neolewinella persica TaxID=70998 RepID=UPI0012FB2A72|nr:hypothetical protein [Neolewinella persica]
MQYILGWSTPWVDAYLDPLLALPILLGLLLFERRLIFRIQRLSLLEVCLVSIVLMLIFEEGFPRWEPAFVRDYYDYIAYLFGSVYFWYAVNLGPNKN